MTGTDPHRLGRAEGEPRRAGPDFAVLGFTPLSPAHRSSGDRRYEAERGSHR